MIRIFPFNCCALTLNFPHGDMPARSILLVLWLVWLYSVTTRGHKVSKDNAQQRFAMEMQERKIVEKAEKWDWKILLKNVVASRLSDKNDSKSSFLDEPMNIGKNVRIARIDMNDLKRTLEKGILEQLSSHVRTIKENVGNKSDEKSIEERSIEDGSNVNKSFDDRSREPANSPVNYSSERMSKSGNSTTTHDGTLKDIRRKRYSKDYWIEQNFDGHDNLVQIQALIVRDEDITGCRATASDVTNTRYFMCSGAILTEKHVITTASCIHFAHVSEHHIEADLAVLLGAFYEKSYVIKIERFEMHPHYVYDVDSPLYSVHNLAIVFLDCPIPRAALSLPRIPMDEFEDVGHLCCPQSCEMMTVVQKWNNRHEARLIKPQHLPPPTHEKFDDTDFSIPVTESPYKRPCRRRESRSPAKLAPAPTFFTNERKNPTWRPGKAMQQENDSWLSTTAGSRRKLAEPELDGFMANRREAAAAATNDAAGPNESDDSQENAEVASVSDEDEPEDLAANNEPLVPVDLQAIEKAAAMTSENLSDTSKEAVSLFTKNVVDVTLRKLNEILDEDGGITDVSPSSYFGQKNMSMDNIADVLARTIITTTLEDLNITNNGIDRLNSIEPPMEMYQKCPPLGSPIVLEDVLIGLVAYTCDDLQDWVPWQYVSLSKNIQWIREKISETAPPSSQVLSDEDEGFPNAHKSVQDVEMLQTINEEKEQRPEEQQLNAEAKVLPLSSKTNVNINQCVTDEQGITRCTTRMIIRDDT